MRIQLNYRLLVIVVLFTIGCSLTIAQDSGSDGAPVFAWVSDGDLYVMDGLESEAQVIASGDIQSVKLSPQGSRVAFRRGPDADASLWVVDANGSEPVQIAEATYPIEMVWLNEATLFYNTAEFDPNTGFELNNDLWRADVETAATTRYSVGGQINLSPDGAHLVIVNGGNYEDTPAEIWHVDPEDPDGAQRLYSFEAIASGHHDSFYPQISWIAIDRVALAVPPPDLLYAPPDARPSTELVALDMTGKIDVMGTIVTDLFAFPVWSPDGQHLLYSETDTGTNTTLWLAETDGSNGQIVDQLQHSAISATPQWISDTQFIYIKSNAYYIGELDAEPAQWLEDAYVIPKIAGAYVMYIVPAEEHLYLRVAHLRDDSYTQLTDKTTSIFWDITVPLRR